MKQLIGIVALALVILLIAFGYNKWNDSRDIKEDVTEELEDNSEEKNMTTATFKTNKGEFQLELFTEQAPKTTENFIKLANDGFYDGTKFHRIIPDFMIQGGDPLTKDDSKQALWGTGDPGYKFEDEFGEGLSNITGTISMANSGPNTNGSQFFINVGDNTFLDGKHAVFGKISNGMELVLELSKVETEDPDRPIDPVIIESVEISN